MAEAHKQIHTTIPDQIRKIDAETQVLKAKKTAITREVQKVKDQINEIDI